MSRRGRSKLGGWLWKCCCCCCCCCHNDTGSPGLMVGSSPPPQDEGFSELSVVVDAKGEGETQEQEVLLREELHTPRPQHGEKVTEHKEQVVLRDKKPASHSGSLVRNSGARMSWRMVPSENRRLLSSSETSTPERSAQADEVSTHSDGLPQVEVPSEEKEVVLKEVETEAGDKEQTREVFSSIIAISTTTTADINQS